MNILHIYICWNYFTCTYIYEHHIFQGYENNIYFTVVLLEYNTAESE
jgi:hypothetical protein